MWAEKQDLADKCGDGFGHVHHVPWVSRGQYIAKSLTDSVNLNFTDPVLRRKKLPTVIFIHHNECRVMHFSLS